MSANYVVAASRAWDRAVFDDLIASYSGTWTLVTSPAELSRERLLALTPRFVFFLHWSWKVPADIVEGFECVGFHMTDLPYGRGGSPLQNLILRGHKTTMISAFRLEEKMDAGPVYLKAPLALDGSAQEIYSRAFRMAATMVKRIIEETPTPVPQQGDVVTFPRRTPAESILPDDSAPEAIYDFIRMLDAEGYPRAFVETGTWRCEFSRATLDGDTVRAEARFSPVSKPEGK
jgi:methionyl-tRNA formyltransferase